MKPKGYQNHISVNSYNLHIASASLLLDYHIIEMQVKIKIEGIEIHRYQTPAIFTFNFSISNRLLIRIIAFGETEQITNCTINVLTYFGLFICA